MGDAFELALALHMPQRRVPMRAPPRSEIGNIAQSFNRRRNRKPYREYASGAVSTVCRRNCSR
jgi:hypothetical protein